MIIRIFVALCRRAALVLNLWDVDDGLYLKELLDLFEIFSSY